MRAVISIESEGGEIWPSKVTLIPEAEDDPMMTEALRERIEMNLVEIVVVNG